MSFIKRSPDAGVRAATVLGLALAFVGAATSCDDDPSNEPPQTPDADPAPDTGAGDGGVEDAATDAPLDVRRLTVSCAEQPCAKDLSASWSESFCALLDDGRVACWGRNEEGELGRDAGPWAATAEPIDGVAGATALDRTCAVLGDGGIVCWGEAAALTPDAGATVHVPLPPARAVRTGSDVACALGEDGKVACWGRNGPDGVLAYAGDDAGASNALVPPTAVPLGGAIDELAIARGQRTMCNYCPIYTVNAIIARRTDGTVVSWGVAPFVGRFTSRVPDPDPAPVALEPHELFGGYGACARTGGALRCWGHRPDDLGTPRPLSGLPHGVQASLGSYQRDRVVDNFCRGCATTAAGEVFCWGENDFGQAGDGTTWMRDLPVRVEGLPEPIVRVEVTRSTSCALGVGGRVYCWGDDGFGQRGQKTPYTADPAPLRVELP